MKRKLIGAGAGLLVLLGLSLFLLWGFRNPVINSMAERKILAMNHIKSETGLLLFVPTIKLTVYLRIPCRIFINSLYNTESNYIP